MEIITLSNQELTPNSPLTLTQIVNNFILDQDVKESSRKLYRRTLKQYFNWVDRKGLVLTDMARHNIINYKEDLFESGISSLTVASYITSVRKFYEWAESKKYYPNIAKGIKSPKRKQQFKKQPLTPGQATDLLNYYSSKSKRDFAITNLLLRGGLRTIEVVRATVGDIVFKGSQRVLMVHGKGSDEKDNFIILTDKAYNPIKSYLETRENVKDNEPLFTSTSNNNTGGKLTTRTISKIAKEGLKAIGLNDKSFTAHSLRHTTAVNILRAGGSLEMAQMTLRHSNPATTQIYTATINEERRLKESGESLIDGLF